MTTPVSSSGTPEPAPSPIVTPDAQTAGLAATSGGSTKTVKSMEDLHNKAPDVEKAMLMGIAQTICGRLREAEEHRKEINKENQRYS